MNGAVAALSALGVGPAEFVPGGHYREAKGIDPVSNSPELARISTIPRRLEEDSYAETEALVYRPGATMRLRPNQLRALSEARRAGGLFAPLAVGAGKTLVAALLPTVLAAGYTVILTNAGLVRQAAQEMLRYAAHFYIRQDIRWLSYGILSSPKQFAILERLQPKVIIADECQALASADAARAKRFNRFMKAHPETLFCAMSGTITKRSIKDYAHLVHLALGDRTPLPRDWKTLTEWAEAVDVSDRPRPPGSLLELMTDTHASEFLHTRDYERIRRGRMYLRGAAMRPPDAESGEAAELQNLARDCIRRRTVETLGVVASSSNDLACKLLIELVPAPECPEIGRVHREVLENWERPDGELLTFALEIARVSMHVRQGGYYRWVWPERVDRLFREDWLLARRTFRSELRDFLKHRSGPGLDSPHLVEQAIKRGQLSFDSWAGWVEARAEMTARLGKPLPPKEWVWISSKVVEDAARRAQEQIGIVWTNTTAVGHEIARLSGAPWFGAGEEAQVGILREAGARSIIASVKAHGTGRNLQAFSHALVVGAPSSGAITEQLLGRLMREGQRADVVRFRFYDSFKTELEQAARYAQFIERISGNAQHLLTCQREGF